MHTILPKIGSAIATIGLVVGGWFGFLPGDKTGAAVQPFGGQTYTLAGNGVTGSATSLTLQSLTIPQTGQKILDADMSTTFFLTLEPSNRTKQEFVACTTVTQNSGGTATLSGCTRGLSPIPPYTASTTLQFVHAGGSQIIFSNPPQFYNQYTARDNAELIPSAWTASTTNPWKYDGTLAFGSTTNQFPTAESIFKNFVRSSADTTISATTTAGANHGFVQALPCTNASDLCNKTYVDAVSVAGAANADQTTKGISEEATVAEINAGTALGGSGAHLFVNPSQLQYSNYASSSPWYIGTSTSAAKYFAKTLSMSAGDVVIWWGDTDQNNTMTLSYRISSGPCSCATTTPNPGAHIGMAMWAFQATTTETVTFAAIGSGGALNSTMVLQYLPILGFNNQI